VSGLGFEILAQFHCALPSALPKSLGIAKLYVTVAPRMRGFFLIRPTHTGGRHAELRKYKAMSLFRCQDKLAGLFMYAKFIILLSAIGTSLIASKHKKPIPILLYMRTLVSRGIIGRGIFNTRNDLHIEEERMPVDCLALIIMTRRLSNHKGKLPISVL
jgi:hypothetical protein